MWTTDRGVWRSFPASRRLEGNGGAAAHALPAGSGLSAAAGGERAGDRPRPRAVADDGAEVPRPGGGRRVPEAGGDAAAGRDGDDDAGHGERGAADALGGGAVRDGGGRVAGAAGGGDDDLRPAA